MTATTRYRAVTILALVGLFISAYMLLYALGFYGMILCGTGSCEVVQSSKWAVFLGIPVPAWGAAWYGAVLILALALAGRTPEGSRPAALLALLATGGLAFSGYLTALEAFVIHAWCRWCIVSAVLTLLIFLLVAPWRRLASGRGAPESFESVSVE